MDENETPSPVYFLRLMNGDSIIGRSDDDMTKINEVGNILMRDVMRMKNQMVANPHTGEVMEMTILVPWLEGSYLQDEVAIPTDTVVAATVAKASIVVKYARSVVGQLLKEQAQEEAFLRSLAPQEEKVEQEEEGPKPEPKMLVIPPKPRQPELLTKERMIEAELDGELEDEDETDDAPSAQPSADLSYQVDGKTYH